MTRTGGNSPMEIAQKWKNEGLICFLKECSLAFSDMKQEILPTITYEQQKNDTEQKPFVYFSFQ